MHAIRLICVCGMVMGVVLLLPVAIAPKATWWLFEAWKYNNPDANEPSDQAYFWMRIESIYSIAGLSLFIFALLGFN
jgi:hypothetical protein